MRKLYLISFILLSFLSRATHNRAGEILYKRIAPFSTMVGGVNVQVYTYSFTIIKYTNDGNNVADRCVDTLYFGDGTRGEAKRTNGPVGGCNCDDIPCGEIVINNQPPGYYVKKNIYTIVHTFAGPGTYTVRSLDPMRNEGVINMNNSVNVPFYIESLLIINPITGANSSPTFSFDPTDLACHNKCFYHNPGAYDVDGDSLSFALTTCRGVDGQTVPGYWYPNQVEGGTYSINPVSGLLTWCSPQSIAQYNLAFVCYEWRKNTGGKYQIIGYVLRDMQVIVQPCPTNDPPTLKMPADTCVEAGTYIDKTIEVNDPNGNFVTVSGGGGAFSAIAPTAAPSTTSSIVPYTFQFTWQTGCQHIRSQPYICVFKAEDNQVNELVTFANYNIRVVPPSVKNVTAVPFGANMNVTWSLSACNPANNPIIGYRIYRMDSCKVVTFDPCKTGVDPTLGFTYLGQAAATSTLFTDTNGGNGLVVGQDYSYVVVAQYADGSQSFASTQVCAKLKRDVPIILNVDVLTTLTSNASVFVKWARPLKTVGNLDTLIYPGPYTFNLKHRTGGAGSFSTVFTSTANFLYLLDTSYTHNGLNTVAGDHQYEVEFLSGANSLGSSQKATSIFLSATPNDRRVDLSWTCTTPWINSKYTIYRLDPGAVNMVTVGVTSNTSYSDTLAVKNHSTYCYKIQSEGAYTDASIPKPLINNSQTVCATAIDLTPPCTPTVTVNATCLGGNVTVTWNNVSLSCSDDVTKYILYKKKHVDDEFVKLDTIMGAGNITMTFPPENSGDVDELIQSCYAIESVDLSGNVSKRSPDYCVDNCPEFELPNIITLNGDGVNDHFKAIKVRQIREIELYVFDRWGNQVYKTTDPYFKWDGKSAQSGQTVSDGTFFYICDVYEPRVTGVKKRSLRGYLQVAK